MQTAHLSIDYEEGDQSTYRAVELRVRQGEVVIRCASADPVKDWERVVYLADLLRREEQVDVVMFSSSCDHFVMDGESFCFDENEMIQRISEPARSESI